MSEKSWKTTNPDGKFRVMLTKNLPGSRWVEILTNADCRVDICDTGQILSSEEILEAIGDMCHGAIGQLTERWNTRLLETFSEAGGKVYSNYAVGCDNVDIDLATSKGIPVGNTPGVLTEATAEMAVALTFAAARRVVEGDGFMREGRYHGWLPSLFLGELLRGKTLGIIGAGRIGAAYARMMVEGHKMDLVYFNRSRKKDLEDSVRSYGAFLSSRGEAPVTCHRAESIEELLRKCDVVSLHASYSESVYHLIDGRRLRMMKENALLVNTSRGPIIDEKALVEHCSEHGGFKAALDVYEKEPLMQAGLKDLDNVVLAPHLGSATRWTREAMAVLAASNIAAVLQGYPAWNGDDMTVFLGQDPPGAAPSIVNADSLGMAVHPG